MAPWQGKWALVTGASAGIGIEIAKQLAAEGANLVLTARRIERLAQLAEQLTTLYKIKVEVFPSDLTQPCAPEEIFRFTNDQNLPIEVLINNAGFGASGAFAKIDLRRQLEMVQVNVTAVVHLTRLFVQQMIERRSGYIMIVASTASFRSRPLSLCLWGHQGLRPSFRGRNLRRIARHCRSARVSALCPGPHRERI